MQYALNLPEYGFSITHVGETRMIFDPLRGRYVKLTPEEWVRQNLVQYLIQDLGYPRSLIGLEKGFTHDGRQKRADVVAHDRTGRVLLVAECKAPAVQVAQPAFDQVAFYNRALGGRYLVVTNGYIHYCCHINQKAHTCTFLEQVPPFAEAEKA